MKQSPLVLVCAFALAAVPRLGQTIATEARGPKCVVFQEEGFPAADSEAVGAEVLRASLGGFECPSQESTTLPRARFLRGAALLVLPYGSAFPVDGWSAIRTTCATVATSSFSGRPLFVPVRREQGRFAAGPGTSAYAREMGLAQAFEAPRVEGARLAWEDDFAFETPLAIRARRVFSVERLRPNAGYLRGLPTSRGPAASA